MASNVSEAGWGGALGAFGRWWASELQALLPFGVRRLLGLQRDVLLIEMDERQSRLRRLSGSRSTDFGPLGGGRRASASGAGRVVLRLAPGMGLQKILSLPQAAEEDLRQVLEFEMERQTPFRADQVRFYHQVLERWPAERTLRLKLTVVPRQTVEAALLRAADAGFLPEIVDLGDGTAPVDARCNLLPPEARPRTGRRGVKALAALALLMLAAAVASPLIRYGRAVEQGGAELEALRPAAQRALDLRNQLDERLGGAAAVAAIKASAPVVVLLLEEMTRLFPDDTWVTQWNLVEDRIEVEGVSASASALITAIEDSPLYRDVSIRTPIVRDPGTGLERFQFSIGLEAPAP